MGFPRDPLSVRYDGVALQVLTRAARASASGRGVTAWIASPRGEFRAADAGGRTAHERAFTRAAYYLVKGGPNHSGSTSYGMVPEWSLKLVWGGDEDLKASSHGRLARPVVVRLFPRGKARVRRGESWRDDPSRQSRYVDGKFVPGY